MVEFCPECSNMIRRGVCRCGYNAPPPPATKTERVVRDRVVKVTKTERVVRDGVIKATKTERVLRDGVIQIWKPPSANIIYSKITGTPIEKLQRRLNKGFYPEKLKKIREKLKKRLFSCHECVYAGKEDKNEDVLNYQKKNKFRK